MLPLMRPALTVFHQLPLLWWIVAKARKRASLALRHILFLYTAASISGSSGILKSFRYLFRLPCDVICWIRTIAFLSTTTNFWGAGEIFPHSFLGASPFIAFSGVLAMGLTSNTFVFITRSGCLGAGVDVETGVLSTPPRPLKKQLMLPVGDPETKTSS